jgi:NTP pyrophosphatase (non-canonical NTP hydrolase)
VSCPKHPQAREWESASGKRCAICGDLLGIHIDREPEVPVIRTFAVYRQHVERTDSNPEGHFPLEYHAGCLCEEAGEVHGKVKKVVYHGHAMDDAMRAAIMEELGDLLWYLDRVAERVGVTLEQVAQANMAKLRRRYPNGFEKARSQKRDG